MLTDLPGVAVGHVTDAAALTGCTVVLFPDGTVASGEVRGGAPGTREFALLAPEKTVARVDAVVLAGGSAFGLAGCDGVMQWCAERERGFVTGAGIVPIVVGMVLYDLAVGDGSVRPTAADGYAACDAAVEARAHAVGTVGAGTGATVGKWRGPGHARAAGVGTATVRSGDVVVSALFAVNAYGDVVAPGTALPAEEAGDLLYRFQAYRPGDVPETPGPTDPAGPTENTTIGVVATNARLDKVGCLLLAQSAHDGLARVLWPVHATADGDAVVAASVGGGTVDAPVDLVRMLAVEATARAILASVPTARA